MKPFVDSALWEPGGICAVLANAVVLEEEMSIKICLKLLRISPLSVILFIINGRPWEISCELEMSSEG